MPLGHLAGQAPRLDRRWSPLARDGNGVPALQGMVTVRTAKLTVGDALEAIAAGARIDLAFDPTLPELRKKITLTSTTRRAAEVLLRVVEGTSLELEVGPRGEVAAVDRASLVGTIVGRILRSSDSTPIADVAVALADTKIGAVTDARGRFTLSRVPRGTYTLRAYKLGLESVEDEIDVAVGDSLTLDIHISRGTATLDAVRVEAMSREQARFTEEARVSDISVTGRELSAAPVFVEPDVLRAVQSMPGIQARSDYAAAYNVRGGEGDQNLVLLDGYPLYDPFHLGGLFSTFIDPTVGRVDMLTGGFPVQYGGRMSSVLDVRSADETRAGLHGTVETSLASTTGSVGGRADDGSGAWMVAARRTYADVIADLFKPGSLPYHFEDAQAHAWHTLPGDARIAFTAYDGLDVDAAEEGAGFQWGNALAGMTLSKAFRDKPRLGSFSLGDSLVVQQSGSVTRFGSHFALGSLFAASSELLEDRVSGSVTSYHHSGSATIGYELVQQRTSYDATSAFTTLGDIVPFDSIAQHPRSASVYANDSWRPFRPLLLDLGERVDAVNARGWTGLSPRLSAKYFLGDNMALTAAAGIYTQWLHSLGREEELAEPLQFWVASDSLRPVSRARSAVLGVETWLSPSRLLHVELFYKRYDHLLIPNVLSDPQTRGDEFLSARGTSYGADLLLREFQQGPFSGWVAYTYALSDRVLADGTRYAPAQDHRHDLSFVGSWRRKRTTLGARFSASSGAPYTPASGIFVRDRYDPITRTWAPDQGLSDEQIVPGAFNSARLPFYQRLDVSASRDSHWRGSLVTPFISILNLYNAKNTMGYVYSFDSSNPKRVTVPELPFMPTFGVKVVY